MSKIPELVMECPICHGKGEYEQWYTAGCGGGSYRSQGPCDFCKVPYLFMRGAGYVYKDRASVIEKGGIPESVFNQMGLRK